MSNKCRAYSESKLGLEPPDNRKAFYAGWDAALRAALAEPEQEPVQEEVYWYVGTDGKYHSSNEVKLFMDAETKSLHLDPPQWRKDKGDLIPLYTSPIRRKPLTEVDLRALYDGHAAYQEEGPEASGWWDFARAIERAHWIWGDE